LRHFLRRLRYTSLILLVFLICASLMLSSSPSYCLHELPESQRRELADYLALRIAADAREERRSELQERIAGLEGEIQRLEDFLAEAEDRYEEARERTVTALRWLHRMGPASYLEVLLSASSLRDLLQRTEVVAAAARGSLLALTDIRREKLTRAELQTEIDEMGEELAGLKEERDELLVVFDELDRVEGELSREFGGDWPRISDDISELAGMYEDEVIPYLEDLSSHFAEMAEEGAAPADVIIRPSLFQVRAIVPAASLNEVLDQRAGLRGAAFELEPEEVRLVCPQLRLSLSGELSLGDRGIITYDPDAVYLGGLKLTDEHALEAVGRIDLDLSAAMADLQPRELTVREDEVELVLTLIP